MAIAARHVRPIAPHSLDRLSSAPSSVQTPFLLCNGWAIIGLSSLLAEGAAGVAGSGGQGGSRRLSGGTISATP
jgi:hypothetical protein